MGKRSRKRTGSVLDGEPAGASANGTTRAERDAARARRATAARGRPERSGGSSPRAARPARGERPPAPWGSFPLVELCVLLAIVFLIGGFVVGDRRGATMIVTGLALGSLGGLELSIREHFAGYRSHTILLSGGGALAAATLLAAAAGKILLPILAAVALVVFGACFLVLRRVFKKRSGGLSFR